MKKAFLLFCLFCLLLGLTGCGTLLPESDDRVLIGVAGQDAYIVFDEGRTDSGTVESDNGVYHFQYTEDLDLTITYPDGKVFTWVDETGRWPYDVLPENQGYLPGEDLALSLDLASGADLIRHPPEKHSSGVSPILLVVIAAIGFWLLISPRRLWRLVVESFRPDAEPQPRTLLIFRIVGAALAAAACLLLFLQV